MTLDIEEFTARIRSEPARRDELLPLLHEGHPVYAGRGESVALRIRGWIMATYETVGLPVDAAPLVLETLYTALDAFAVAAAARAARGGVVLDPELPKALVAALTRMRGRDDTVTFAALRPRWPAPDATTALTEILRTLRDLGPLAHGVHDDLVAARREHASTWNPLTRKALDAAIESTARSPLTLSPPLPDEPPPTRRAPVSPGRADVTAVALEDQSGTPTTFGEHFTGRRHIVAFFYTRCGNPVKCSATVHRLADLARRLPDSDRVGIAGISYDPGFDTPERLATYGSARGLAFSHTVRLFRATRGHEVLRAHFDLQVGYNGTLVNQHGVELFLLGPDTRTEYVWTRAPWTVQDVLETLAAVPSTA